MDGVVPEKEDGATMTDMQQRIYNFLPATLQQIGYEFNLSRRAVYRHLTPLHEAGLIWCVSGGMVEKAGKVATL